MKKILKEYCDRIDISISDKQLLQFSTFYEYLIEKNKVMNLTTITEKEDVVRKHFIDSIYILKTISLSGKKVMDVGTGAGFPAIPLSIMCPDAKFVLLDSLNKRIKFLDEVCELCGLQHVETIHSRAEDAARNTMYREKFDIVVSRAVANMSTLLEYCSPFVKVGGQFVSYKTNHSEEELQNAKSAEKILGCKYINSVDFLLPMTDMERRFIIYEKVRAISKKYPRQAGKPKKEPL